MKPLSVTFIGAGNLAWHLAPALENIGFAVREVYSRKEKNAIALAEKLYACEVADSLDFSSSQSRLFILAVADDAIETVAAEITLPVDAMLIHTSGSQPLSVLSDSGASFTGVLYPLQTFSKARRVDFSDIPFFVESDDETTVKTLVHAAKSLSRKVGVISSEERKAVHVAAVFASNFTNHMLTLAREIMKKNELNVDNLKPLIAETINKALELGPHKSQTGPAKRGDLEILDKHFEFLKDDPETAEIYKVISQHILDFYA